MRDFLIAVLFLGMGVLAGVVYTQEVGILADRQALITRWNDFNLNSDDVALDIQGKCAKQAELVYKQGSSSSTDVWSFEDHYNSSLKKCFVLTTEDFMNSAEQPTGRGVFTLSDAFEQKVYGEYIGSLSETPVALCYVYSASGQEITCYSEDQFDKLISQYFGPVYQ